MRTLAASTMRCTYSGRHPLGLHQHPATNGDDRFDEHRPGLDHLSFGVLDRAEPKVWQTRLEELGVPHGEIVDAPYGSGLSFRDPDNIALGVLRATRIGQNEGPQAETDQLGPSRTSSAKSPMRCSGRACWPPRPQLGRRWLARGPGAWTCRSSIRPTAKMVTSGNPDEYGNQPDKARSVCRARRRRGAHGGPPAPGCLLLHGTSPPGPGS